MAREVSEEESYRRADEESRIQKSDKMNKIRRGEVKIYKGKEYIAIPEIEEESCTGCCFYDKGICSIDHAMDYDEQAMKNHDKMAYLKNNKVYLNDIWKCIDKDNRFTPIKQLLGYYYYVEVYKYQGIDMVSESANLVKLYEQKQIANDVVFEMIFHPNGNLNGSWVDNEDILLAYNSYKS